MAILTPLFQLLLPIAQPSYVSVEIGARENDREKKPFKMRYVRGRGNQYYRRYKQKHERRRALRARRRSCFFRVKVDALAYDRKHIKENVRQIVQQSVWHIELAITLWILDRFSKFKNWLLCFHLFIYRIISSLNLKVWQFLYHVLNYLALLTCFPKSCK